jgi:hypothetical protein
VAFGYRGVSHDRPHQEGNVRAKFSTPHVLGLALLLRLVWIAAVPVAPVSDSRWYDYAARSLALGRGYSIDAGRLTAYWPVGPSFAYSVVYRVFGFHLLAAAFFNLVVAMVGVWLAIRVAELLFGWRVGLVAGVLLAVWPEQIEFVTVLSSELLFNLFLLLAVLFWLSGFRERGANDPYLRAVLTGVAVAAACYMRPVALLFPLVFMVCDGIRGRRWPGAVLAAAISSALMLALIAPWTLRNQQLFRAFVPISTNGGSNLYEGNHPGAIRDSNPPPEEAVAMSEIKRDRYLRGYALGYIRAHPVVFLGRVLPKLYVMYGRENAGAYWNRPALYERYGRFGDRAVRGINNAFWFGALAMAVSGMVILWRRSSLANLLTHPCFLICVYLSCVYSVTHAEDRYHFACVPFLAIFAAIAVAERFPLWFPIPEIMVCGF